MRSDDITRAGLSVLIRDGIADWTIAAVAEAAGCAKGLVHYHHKTKPQLLRAMAARLAEDRTESRLKAFRAPGTAALDNLWNELRRAVRSGTTRAWLGLLALSDQRVRESFVPSRASLEASARAIGEALDTEPPASLVVRSIHATLDGFEVGLLRGDDPALVQDAYHRLWLGVL